MDRTGAPPRAEEVPMAKGWEVLSRAIPYGEAEEVAEGMNVSLDIVHRWMRPPSTAEEPTATGRRNPIDYALRLMKEVHSVNPEGAHLIVDAFVSGLAKLERKRSGQVIPIAEIESRLRARAREFEEMANAVAGVKNNEKL